MLVNLLLRRLRKGDTVPVARPFSAFLPLIGGLGNFRVRFLIFDPKNFERLRVRDFFRTTLLTALPSLKAGCFFATLPAPLTPVFTAFLNFLKSPINVFLSLVPYISVGFYLVLITFQFVLEFLVLSLSVR